MHVTTIRAQVNRLPLPGFTGLDVDRWAKNSVLGGDNEHVVGIFMAGAVVVESVFGWPGIGQMAWQAIQMVDIPVIMGVTLVAAIGIILGNLLADLVMPFVDPRMRV